MYLKIFKPIIDFTLAILALVFFSPLFLIITIVLSISNGGSAFFVQERGGKNRSIFKIIKFKTMNDKKDIHGNLLPDKKRITKVGKFIRNSSLDELPQLINVIIGDMSLIGPRPFIAEYLSIYNDYQARRLDVKPGITGWAQVNGRNNLTFNEKFEYDLWYIDNLSFLLDVKILFLTALKVVKPLDINQETSLEVTAEKFNGKN